MVDLDIKQSNKIFILGAGASRELKFRSSVRDVNYYNTKDHFELGPLSNGFFYYIDRFSKKVSEISPMAYGVELEPLANYIIKYYKYRYDADITLDEILRNEQKSVRINIEELFRYIEDDIDKYDSNLANYIFDAFSMISNYCFSIYHSIFAYYVIRNNWNVVSFNWDILFDEAMYYTKLWNYKDGYGLEVDNIFDLTGKAYNPLHNSCSNNLILKPHGSINWYLKSKDANLIDNENLTIFLPRERRKRGRNNKRLREFMFDRQQDNVKPLYRNILIPPSRKRNHELKIYNKIWPLTKKLLEDADEIVIIGFSFNEFDEYITDKFRQMDFKKNVKINIVDPQGNSLINKFKDIFKANEGNIKIIHANFSCYCKWIVRQNGMTDLQRLIR